MSSPSAIDDLKDVLHVTGSLVRWMDLGVELGLSYSMLEAIEVEWCKRVRDCRRDMFVVVDERQGVNSRRAIMADVEGCP